MSEPEMEKKLEAALRAYAAVWKCAARLVVDGKEAAWIYAEQPTVVWDELRARGIDPSLTEPTPAGAWDAAYMEEVAACNRHLEMVRVALGLPEITNQDGDGWIGVVVNEIRTLRSERDQMYRDIMATAAALGVLASSKPISTEAEAVVAERNNLKTESALRTARTHAIGFDAGVASIRSALAAETARVDNLLAVIFEKNAHINQIFGALDEIRSVVASLVPLDRSDTGHYFMPAKGWARILDVVGRLPDITSWFPRDLAKERDRGLIREAVARTCAYLGHPGIANDVDKYISPALLDAQWDLRTRSGR